MSEDLFDPQEPSRLARLMFRPVMHAKAEIQSGFRAPRGTAVPRFAGMTLGCCQPHFLLDAGVSDTLIKWIVTT
jgi:hypothetical protein